MLDEQLLPQLGVGAHSHEPHAVRRSACRGDQGAEAGDFLAHFELGR